MAKDDYKSHGIHELSDYQHLRLRTETYLGSRSAHTQQLLIHTDNGPVIKDVTFVPALLTCVREIIDNSLDEFTKAGINGVLKVDFDESLLKVKIQDNGRGIPIDYNPEANIHLASQVLSRLRAGRNFNDSDREGVAGMNGLGGSAVTNVSKYMNVEIQREGTPQGKRKGKYKFNQRFTEGNYVDDSLQIFEPTIKGTKAEGTGTTCEFELSEDVFTNRQLPTELIYSLLREIAATNINHSIYFNGKKISVKAFAHKTLFDTSKPITYHVIEEGLNSKFTVIPNIIPEGMMMHSLVNNIPTFDGGEHLEEFKKSFFLGLNKALTKESKRRKLTPNRSDLEEGILVYNVTTMNAPYFSSQAKSKLINEDVRKPITNGLDDDFFAQVIKSNKEWIDSIYERCAERTHKKDAADINREAKKALRKKVAKLNDATGKRGKTVIPRNECSLFITEGDSAAAGILNVRDTAIHGTLPLRGKILNVSTNGTTKAINEMKRKVLSSQATSDIMSALGLVIGETANTTTMRYGKLYIATDSDIDGGNICALVINFIGTYWPELLQPDPLTGEAFLQVFQTPFIICSKGKQTSYFYMDNVDDFKPEDFKGWSVTRAKGLGTLEKNDWSHCINNTRSIPIIDDGNLQETMDKIFNPLRADDRKGWMEGKDTK